MGGEASINQSINQSIDNDQDRTRPIHLAGSYHLTHETFGSNPRSKAGERMHKIVYHANKRGSRTQSFEARPKKMGEGGKMNRN